MLVVEDDNDTRAFIARVLLEAGASVAEAANGEEALALVRTNTPSVLVSDIGMAKQDGYQLIRSVRSAGYSAETLPADCASRPSLAPRIGPLPSKPASRSI